MRRRRLSPEQLAKLEEMRERGLTLGHIRRYFARQGITVSRGMIEWQSLRAGADLPPERQRPPRRATTYKRGDTLVRPFEPKDDRRILELEAKGTPIIRIGKLVGRARTSVSARLLILARKEARAEQQMGVAA